jgi:hypothetical protein
MNELERKQLAAEIAVTEDLAHAINQSKAMVKFWLERRCDHCDEGIEWRPCECFLNLDSCSRENERLKQLIRQEKDLHLGK